MTPRLAAQCQTGLTLPSKSSVSTQHQRWVSSEQPPLIRLLLPQRHRRESDDDAAAESLPKVPKPFLLPLLVILLHLLSGCHNQVQKHGLTGAWKRSMCPAKRML